MQGNAQVYAELQLGELPSEVYGPAVERLAGYEPNSHARLPEEIRRRVAKRWGASFARLGYPV